MAIAFNLDFDNCCALTEEDACLYGVIPCMQQFLREVCGKQFGEDEIFCWQTAKLISIEEFKRTTAGTTMNVMLRTAADIHGKRNLDNAVFEKWCRKEQLLCTDHFEKYCKPMPGVREFMTALRPFGFVNITSSSVLFRLWVCLKQLELLDLVDHVVSGEGDGYWRNPTSGEEEVWPVPNGKLKGRFHSLKAHHPTAIGKPHGDLHWLAAHFSRKQTGDEGVAMKHTMVFDDGIAGVQSGVNARADYVLGYVPPCIPTGLKAARAEKLRDAGAHDVCFSLEEATQKALGWAKSKHRPELRVA